MESLQIEVLTYAPTEFFHCLHCEVVFQSVGLGQKVRREQRAAAFPPDLLAATVNSPCLFWTATSGAMAPTTPPSTRPLMSACSS